jgi:hypothetical protein
VASAALVPCFFRFLFCVHVQFDVFVLLWWLYAWSCSILPDLAFLFFLRLLLCSVFDLFGVLFFSGVGSGVVCQFRPYSGGVCVRSSWSSLPEIYGGGLGSCRSSVVHHRVGGGEQ